MSTCNRLDLQRLARMSTGYAQNFPRSLSPWTLVRASQMEATFSFPM